MSTGISTRTGSGKIKGQKVKSVNQEFDELRNRNEQEFYAKISRLMENVVDRMKNTEEKLSIIEQNQLEHSISSIKSQQDKKDEDNPFKMPEIPNIDHIEQAPEPPRPLPTSTAKKLVKKPVKGVTLSDIMDALISLRVEVDDLRANQEEMEQQLVQIKRLIV